jgi:CheY-like chemotaxis protein
MAARKRWLVGACSLFQQTPASRVHCPFGRFLTAQAVAKLGSMTTPDPHPFKGRVLAVDDCAATRELMRASIEHYGHSVQAVDSGWAALAAAGEGGFDAVVLDVEMPGMDGMAVGRALRSDPRTCSAKIAMHSSVDESAVRAVFDQYDAFVPKAGSPRDLGARVDGLLRKRQG